MKREEVQSKIPGITKEQLDWLMDENGKDVTREKSAAATLQTQLNEATAQLKTAQDGLKAFEGVNVAELQGKIQQLTADMAAQKDEFEFNGALDGAIRDAKGRNVNAIRGMMDLAALKASKDRTADIKAALDKLSAENAWAFESAAPAASSAQNSTGMLINTGAEFGTGGSASTDGVETAFAELNPGMKL
jgi:NAD(P)H-dependent FMN reductase